MYRHASQPLPPPWLAATLALLCAGTARAEPAQLARVEVIGSSPLRGSALAREQMPGLVQSLDAADLQRRQALDLSDYLARNLASVSLNETQGNPLQADLNYRGFSASPLLGTPQGLSVYLDGVRMNQPFGDVISWDLIPSSAIEQAVLMPGSNPLFGLNTLGGALALQTKTGLSSPGSAVQLSGGSQRRVLLEFESGGGSPRAHWFLTGRRLHEQGWRVASPSDQSQLFAKLGGRVGAAELRLSLALAGNELSGNGLQEQGALARDWRSIYTAPDTTRNRAQLFNLELNQGLAGGMRLSGNLFYRRISTHTLNGDINEEALGQSLYQPNAEERAALAAAGYSGYPAAAADAANTPFPQWRCIANVLLNEEPSEKCNGLLNRTHSLQQQAGMGLQLAGESLWAGLKSQWLLGAALDWSRVDFQQGTQFGFIQPDRTVSGVEGPGAFADGSQNSEQVFDARVDLRSRGHTASLFASSALSLGPATLLTLAGRYNRASVSNRDQIRPGGGRGSLDGEHLFSHFNPGLGLTHALSPALKLYASASQGARAPTSVELGCADPASPCKLPNAMAGDPPLRQVITHSWELGARGRWAGLDWHLGGFRADNHDDLLFVADNSSGFGYFRNFGLTRRQGLEASLQWQAHRDLRLGANLSLLAATYQSAEQVGGTGNSSNESAQAGLPGLEGVIQIRPGDRIPLLPRRQLKLTLDWRVSPLWNLGLDLQASAGASARGNENGQHRPDGVFYTGPGRSAGYALLNLGLDYRPADSGLKLFLQIKNLLDTRYSTAAQLGANAFDAQGHYRARPLPANANGDYPLIHSTFLAPGAPRAAWVGLRYEFAE